MHKRSLVFLVGLAAVITLLNAVKPLVVDDGVYYQYAAHIAHHPGDPYGFRLYGDQEPNKILAPPVLLYWWAGALRVCGDHPFLWKLSLLPFCLLLVLALHDLARRFAAGLERPLVVLVVLSPIVLPGINFMLDVPALALGLSALTLFLSACDRESWGRALLAGLVAGLAMQTKYTAFVTPLVVLAYALPHRKARLGLVTVGLALLVFASWEGFIAHNYGESHFLHGFHDRTEPLWRRIRLLIPLVGILGGGGAALLVLNVAALGAGRRRVLGTAALVIAGYLLIALVPEQYAVLIGSTRTGKTYLTLNTLCFGGFGLALAGTTLTLLGRLGTSRAFPPEGGTAWSWWRREYFLAVWLGLEVVGYFGLTPYPAARRVMGLIVAGTLFSGSLAAASCRVPERRRLVWAAAGLSAVLGLLYFAIDLCQFSAEQAVAETAAARIHRVDPQARAWYWGDYAVDFYAVRQGLKRWPNGDRGPSAGDWVLVIDRYSGVASPPHDWSRCQAIERWQVDAVLPLRTMVCYYFGATTLEHTEWPLVEATLYRIGGRKFVAAGDVPARTVSLRPHD